MNASSSRLSLGLTLCALNLVSACSPAPKPKPAPVAQTVSVGLIQRQTVVAHLKASGVLRSREEAVISTELNGYRVAKVLIDQGARVVAGQPVAQLDDTLLRLQIAQQKAVVEQQQVAVERAGQEAARVKGLDEAGALSGEVVAERVLAARSAKAVLAQGRAALADLQTRQAMMVVRAPVAGTVLERAIRPGDVISSGQALFKVARDGLVELDAEVPDDRLDLLAAGAPAQVTLASGAKIDGHVRLVSPLVDSQTKLGRIRISLPRRDELRPGAFAQTLVPLGQRRVLVAPVEAIQYNADGASLLVVNAQDRVERRAVQTGERIGGLVEILAGAPEGAKVVLRGGAILLPGDRVNTLLRRGGSQ